MQAVIEEATGIFLCFFGCPVISGTLHDISTLGSQAHYDLLLCCNFSILHNVSNHMMYNGSRHRDYDIEVTTYFKGRTSIQSDSRHTFTVCPAISRAEAYSITRDMCVMELTLSQH